MPTLRPLILFASLAGLVRAQFYTPMVGCASHDNDLPTDLALGRSLTITDFSQQPSNFSYSQVPTPKNGPDGLEFTLSQAGDFPSIVSTPYIMFGHVSVVMKHIKADGIRSRIQLSSDLCDSIQFVWDGNKTTKIQALWYGHNTVTEHPPMDVPEATNTDDFNTYELDWTMKKIDWIVNGAVVRTLIPRQVSIGAFYPQTPMALTLSAFENPLSGIANWTNGPFSMYVKSITWTDYSTGQYYSYTDHSGQYTSLESQGGTINPNGQINATSTSFSSSTSATLSPSANTSSSSSPAVSSTPQQDLSVGAKAGIGVGAAVGGLLVITTIGFIWRRRSRASHQDRWKQMNQPGTIVSEVN